MASSKPSLKRLELSNFKLNSLLEITQLINANSSTEEIVGKFKSILSEELCIGKMIIFSYNQTSWECLMFYGIDSFNEDPDLIVNKHLASYSEITYITSLNTGFFTSFDIIIPVYHKDKAVAYVVIGDFEEDRDGISPTIKHLRFIQTITNIICVAIENKRLYKETIRQEALKKELELASKMQSMLIPSGDNFPHNKEIDVAAYYKPHLEIGGDYYDFINLGEHEYGFCIADISGKGISAAILMSNFQANLRALFSKDIDLKDLIERLNVIVMANANGEKFITFFIAKYNAITRELNYINAGHNPPVIHSEKKKKIGYLTMGSIGLGMFDNMPVIKEGSIKISKNDKIILYTDGLVESENSRQKEFGTIPIEHCISMKMKIETTIDTLINKLTEFSEGVPFFDDITILGVQFK